MKQLLRGAVLLAATGIFQAAPAADIYLIGDYTVADSPKDAAPQAGWGSYLTSALPANTQPAPHVHNLAIAGKSANATAGVSSKSYLASGKFAAVEAALKPGDVMLIAFGHEDERSYDVTVYTNPQTDFPANLMQFASAARAKGAIPVFVTPVTRRSFYNGTLLDSHGPYVRSIRALAARNHIALIDLTADSMAWLNGVGEAASQPFFIAISPGSADAAHPNGVRDDSDLTEQGARIAAALVARRLTELKLSTQAGGMATASTSTP